MTGKEVFMHTGKPSDAATGLYYEGARYYDPTTGRFITQDSISGTQEDPMSLNRYLYAKDNPERLVSPDGFGAVTAYQSGTSYTPSGINGGNYAFGMNDGNYAPPMAAVAATLSGIVANPASSTMNGLNGCAASGTACSNKAGGAGGQLSINVGTVTSNKADSGCVVSKAGCIPSPGPPMPPGEVAALALGAALGTISTLLFIGLFTGNLEFIAAASFMTAGLLTSIPGIGPSLLPISYDIVLFVGAMVIPTAVLTFAASIAVFQYVSDKGDNANLHGAWDAILPQITSWLEQACGALTPADCHFVPGP